jgi:hypothetical protein
MNPRLLVLLVGTASALWILAAAPALGSPDSGPSGRLWLTAQNPAVRAEDTNCLNDGRTYAAAPDPPTAAKAYLGGGASLLGCTTFFQYVAASPLSLSGTARLHVVVGCDVASAALGPTSGLPTIKVLLLKNEETLTNNFTASTASTCSSQTFTYEYAAPLSKPVPVNAGDRLTVRVLSFWTTTPPSLKPNLYVAVGPDAAASWVEAPGLPLPPGLAPPPSSAPSPTPTASPSPSAPSTTSTADDGNETAGPGDGHVGHHHEGEAKESTNDAPAPWALGSLAGLAAVALAWRRRVA